MLRSEALVTEFGGMMKDRRRTNRRLRRDRRWSDDRRTDEVLRLYATLGGATMLALQRMSFDSQGNRAEGITAPDRRRGRDRRARDRRATSDRRELDDPAVVMLAADPIVARRAPEGWSGDHLADLVSAVRADIAHLADLEPPESWSRDRDYMYRTVRAWSHTVTRLAKAVLGLVEKPDLRTALALMGNLRERVQDLCLLQGYPAHDRVHQAARAMLFQALAYLEQHRMESTSGRLEHTIKDLKGRVDRQTYVEIEQLARDPTNHWSSLGAKELAERTPTVLDDRLTAVGLSATNPSGMDLHDVDVLSVRPNVKDYRPRGDASREQVAAVALQTWDWVLASATAVRAVFGTSDSVAVR